MQVSFAMWNTIGSELAEMSGASVPSLRVSAQRPRTTSTEIAPISVTPVVVVPFSTRIRYVFRVRKDVLSRFQLASYWPATVLMLMGPEPVTGGVANVATSGPEQAPLTHTQISMR